MGSQFSRRNENGSSSHPPPSRIDAKSDLIHPDLTSYAKACRRDPDLLSFDSNLQQRTRHVITTLAPSGGGGNGKLDRSLSLNAFREVTEFLLEMNHDVVNVILEYKDDIWKNTDMFDIVGEYFDCSLLTLDFCTELEKCLKRARDSQLMVHLALQQFEAELKKEGGGESKRYDRTLHELRNFSSAGDPFTGEFFAMFQSVYDRQILMLKRLEKKKGKLDKKLKQLKSWRKVSNVIFAATFVAVLICSIVAAAITAPVVVTAVAAAASLPLGTMGKWFNSLWKKYENEVKGQREVIRSMQIGTYIAIKDMDGIRVRVHSLQIEIESLLQKAEFAVREEEAVITAMNEIKKEINGFMQSIEDLSKHANNISREVRMARTVIVRRVIGQATNR